MSDSGTTSAKPQFKQLWPTQFMSMRLPGSDAAHPILADYLLAQDRQRKDMTVDYTSGNLFSSDNKAVEWLHQCCNRAVLDYAREAGIDYDLEWMLHGWANINQQGDYHNLHNHPHAWLSGTYYVSVPDQSKAKTVRSDLNPGSISFFDPRPQANMNSIRNDGQVDAEHRELPKNGDLFLWPAFLHHLVHPNMSEQPRISVSFNVVLKWKNEYIPR